MHIIINILKQHIMTFSYFLMNKRTIRYNNSYNDLGIRYLCAPFSRPAKQVNLQKKNEFVFIAYTYIVLNIIYDNLILYVYV